MAFRCDPDLKAIPTIGEGTLDIAGRTTCGEAARFTGDLQAMLDFIGDNMLVLHGDTLYRKMTDGTLAPMPVPKLDAVIVKPPAGECFVIDEHTLRSQYASVVTLPAFTGKTTNDDGHIVRTLTLVAAKKPAAKKPAAMAPAKKATPTKK